MILGHCIAIGGIPYLVRRLRDVEGFAVRDDLAPNPEEFAESRSQPIPEGLWKRLRAMQNRELGGETILEVRPHDGELVFEASIASASLNVNILRRFRVPDNQISRGLFAALLREPLAEIVVRGARDRATGFVSQFTFYYSLQLDTARGEFAPI